MVTLSAVIYRETEYIGIKFLRNVVIEKALRNLSFCRWNAVRKCWLSPMNRESCAQILNSLKGVADVDITNLKSYLIKRSGEQDSGINVGQTFREEINIDRTDSFNNKRVDRNEGIEAVNSHVLPDMLQHLMLKSYSRSTIKTYLNEMAQYLRTLGGHSADQLSVEQIKRYLIYCAETLQLKENTLHSRINALKFYYEQVRKGEKFYWDIPRPKKQMQLPKLLNEMEIANLFNSVSNKKHKAMLFMVYSAGLRVSELVNLRLADIDSKRMQVFVANAKGKKDRYVNLSPLLLDVLREYVKTYNPRPREFLFESDQTGCAYPTRTVQQIFSNAKRLAGIRKDVGIHSLRHSFATHLLDKGTDIKFIKELLGHFNIKTTERYLHVSNQQLINVESPFDELWKSGKIKW